MALVQNVADPERPIGAEEFVSQMFGGYVPKGGDPKVEEEVNLPTPVPVYMTYLTVLPNASGSLQFLADPYGRDEHLMERFGSRMVAAVKR